MDRYYTGLQIFADLKKLQIGACGTLRIDRGQLTDNIKTQVNSLDQKEIIYFKTKNQLLLSCWRDSKAVLVLSNCYGIKSVETERRKKRKEIEKEERKSNSEQGPIDVIENVKIPYSISQYNKFMGGVDLFDQKAENYGILLRSHRWYVKIFFHLLEISLINSYIIYTKVCEKSRVTPKSHLQFRKEVARGLLQPMRERLQINATKTKIGASSKKRNADQPIISQSPCKLEERPIPPNYKTNRTECEEHSSGWLQKNNRVSQTIYWCVTCKVALCRLICFDIHSKKHLH